MPTNIFEIDPDGNSTFVDRLSPDTCFIRENTVDEQGIFRTLMIHCSSSDNAAELYYVDTEACEEGISFTVTEDAGTVLHENVMRVTFEHAEMGRMALIAEHHYIMSDC